jgi:hypothetical protein
VQSVQPFPVREGSGDIRDGVVTFANLSQRPAIRTRKSKVLRSRDERIEFLRSCEQSFGASFSVFVDGDPSSIRQLDTDGKKQAFAASAPVRPWEARAFPRAEAVQ